MVEVVAELAAVEGFVGCAEGEVRVVCGPDYGALEVGEPPDAGVFALFPEGVAPVVEDVGERDEALGPGDVEVWDCLEGHVGDYAETA